MDIAEVTDRIRAVVGDNAGIDSTLKFDFGPAGQIFIDGASQPNQVTNEDKPADCTLRVSWQDFESMAKGALDPAMAFLQGKLKVDGDMSVAMRLQPIIAKLK